MDSGRPADRRDASSRRCPLPHDARRRARSSGASLGSMSIRMRQPLDDAVADRGEQSLRGRRSAGTPSAPTRRPVRRPRGAVGRRSPSSTSAMQASTMASRVRSARAVRPSIVHQHVTERHRSSPTHGIRSRPMGTLLDLSACDPRGEPDIEDHHPSAPTTAGGGRPTASPSSSLRQRRRRRTPATGCASSTPASFAAPAIHDAVAVVVEGPAHDRRVHARPHRPRHGHRRVREPRDRAAVIGHEAVDARFDRYSQTAGYNAVINQRQFRAPGLQWPLEYRQPDVTYRDHLDLDLGGDSVELHHARGETDDHTWVWLPERRTLCTGDLIIWCTPNAGNPQKVQRYADDWAVASARDGRARARGAAAGSRAARSRAPTTCRMVLDDTADAARVARTSRRWR